MAASGPAVDVDGYDLTEASTRSPALRQGGVLSSAQCLLGSVCWLFVCRGILLRLQRSARAPRDAPAPAAGLELPSALMEAALSYADVLTIARCACVSREWRLRANSPDVWHSALGLAEDGFPLSAWRAEEEAERERLASEASAQDAEEHLRALGERRVQLVQAALAAEPERARELATAERRHMDEAEALAARIDRCAGTATDCAPDASHVTGRARRRRSTRARRPPRCCLRTQARVCSRRC